MAHALDRLTIKGFKSIRALEDFELTNLNVLIGGNGAGKSNLIEFFRMLRAMMELPLPRIDPATLVYYVLYGGGSDDFLFNGPKITKQIEAEMYFGPNGYRFKLVPEMDENFIINDEAVYLDNDGSGWQEMGSGRTDPYLLNEKNKRGATGISKAAANIYDSISSLKIYHLNDTSKIAPMLHSSSIHDYEYFRFDAANIAPFMLHLRENEPASYDQIVETIRLIAPFFGDFILRPTSQEKVRLFWRQKGSDYPLKPQHLSDGTIRFISLATVLLQPNPPSTIIIDEPELGLHPFAIDILAELIKSAATQTQLIISTQSVPLVDCFEPEDIIVVERQKGESIFRRLNSGDLSIWLDDYSLGELWRKNIFDGGPTYE